MHLICAGSLDLTAENIALFLTSIGSPVAMAPVDTDAVTLVFDAPEVFSVCRKRVRSWGWHYF